LIALLKWAQQKDEKYFFLIFDNKSKRSFWKIFFGYVSKTGDGYLLFITILYGFFISDSSYQFIIVALFAIALDKIVYLILKKSLKRPRPFRKIEGVNSKLIPFDEFSFPSGHTGSATVLTLLVYYFFPISFLGIFLFWTIFVGISRIYLGVHYPSDVFAGAILGYLSFFISSKLLI
tara:strand:+ start:1099 stop:1629 length:531 start_codon:yes stop_codon:yes gene_type:complete